MSFLIGTLSFLMLAISLFMILLVLIQRGRGGGLAGTFGGMGGQSAFGTRAGDTFTRITIVLAVIWVLLAGGLGMMMRRDAEAAKTGQDVGGFSSGQKSDKQDDADEKSDEGAMIDEKEATDAAETTDRDQPKADDAVPGESATPEAADTTVSGKTPIPAADAETPDAEKSDTVTKEEESKETPAEPLPLNEDAPATEPKP